MGENSNNIVNSTICILGGSGFVGRHLIEALTEEGNVKVKVLSRQKEKLEFCSGNVQVIVGDLMKLDSLVNFLEPGAITINLAYLNAKPMDDNLQAIHNLVRACVEVGVTRLIHCGTAAVVGHARDDVITEESICLPVTAYEKTKLAIEDILLNDLKDKIEVVIVRPTAIFGEYGKNLMKLTGELSTESRVMRMIKMSINSRRRMNLVYVKNVVEAILFLTHLKTYDSGQRYIVSDDDVAENNYSDVTKLLSDCLDLRRVSTIHIPFQPLILGALLNIFQRSNTNPRRVYSSEKLHGLGFERVVSFQDGIKRFALWYRTGRKI